MASGGDTSIRGFDWMSVSWGTLVLLASGLWACQATARRPAREGHLEVSWNGKDRGSVAGTATARWCGLLRVMEVRLVRGDTGVAVALYPVRSPASGTYPVVAPAKAESLPPAAAIGVRWLGQSVVQGFQGESGQVVLQRSSAGLFSGRLKARARSVVDTQHIALNGSFRDLILTPDSLGCSPTDEDMDEDAETVDTGVH
jgi:hypothetical protein